MKLLIGMRNWEWKFVDELIRRSQFDEFLWNNWFLWNYHLENNPKDLINFLTLRNMIQKDLILKKIEIQDIVYDFIRVSAYRINVRPSEIIHFFVYIQLIKPTGEPSLQFAA
ncbi:MAG: hypothetical protein NZ853_06870 [Leptospiraceae bacterium]|nr:hypothetical protein [Leptospiraceae bacterium]MDW7975844.1 hypothetical protein [Leptospiraceae bacterium]